jgi:hypothetical protein
MRAGLRAYGRASIAFAAFACALSLLQAAAQAAGNPAVKKTAVLLRGTYPLRGLPFFGPNAIQSLYGEYHLGIEARDAAAAARAVIEDEEKHKASRVAVWYTREPLVISAEDWKPTASSALRVLAQPDRPSGSVLFVKGGGYSLFFECNTDNAELRSFALALNRKFAVFFNNASSDAELSFPALVEY